MADEAPHDTMIGIRTKVGDDHTFTETLTELSRRAGERSVQRSSLDPAAAAQARHAALQAYDRARAQRLRWLFSLAAGALVGTAVAAVVPMITSSPMPTITTASALPGPAVPEPSLPARESPPVDMASAPTAVVQDVWPDSVVAGPIPATSSPVALQHDEVLEIQTRLRSFGFDPGPVDGVAGRMTENAIARYQQERTRPQTGTADRRLLEQLRQDPAPQVRLKQTPTKIAQRPARPDAPAPRPVRTRKSDPLQPVKDGFDGLGRWIDSIVR